MVLQRRLHNGFNRSQVPAMFRVPRSAKGKRSVRKKVEKNQMHAFDLLAEVARSLLSEKESSLNPTIACGTNPSGKDAVNLRELGEKPCKNDAFVHGSCNESKVDFKFGHQRLVNHPLEENLLGLDTQGSSSGNIKSDGSDGDTFSTGFLASGYSPGTTLERCGIDRLSPGPAESHEGRVKEGNKAKIRATQLTNSTPLHRNALEICSLEDPMELDIKCPALAISNGSVEVPLCGDWLPRTNSLPNCRYGMKLAVNRDDDEKSSGCSYSSTITSKAFRPHILGYRKMRKMLASKLRKTAPTVLKRTECSNKVVEMKPVCSGGEMYYTRKRSQRSFFKRKRLYEPHSLSTSDGMTSHGNILNFPVKDIKAEASTSYAANVSSSSAKCQSSSYPPEEYHVKLCIKSVKVPELVIEIPETASVGCLKRTVMEAITTLLGGGLHVGVVLQGKKVRDDNKTLLQAGISCSDKVDNVGFILEPNPSQANSRIASREEHHLLISCDSTDPITRLPSACPSADPGTSGASPASPLASLVNGPESDHDSVHSPVDTSPVDKTLRASRALVPVPSTNMEEMAMVPMHKARRCELIQRRIRRPFSVSEVEALVHAVEKLGTGRWRDVKLRAFDDASHRTYVDLKDKWKTLVHTAKISPQQRRGEPVPQELLDRVLASHSYWSQQQIKLQMKPSQAEVSLLL